MRGWVKGGRVPFRPFPKKVAALPKSPDDKPHEGTPAQNDQRGPEGGALATAAQFLRRLRPDDGDEAVPDFSQPEREWGELRAYAQKSGLTLPAGWPGPEKEGGREHDVRYDAATGSWWKYTKRNGAGYTVDWTGRLQDRSSLLPALPGEYLERLRAQNDLFSDDIRLEGLWPDGSANWRIVTSQPDVPGRAASPEEIQSALEEMGWRLLPYWDIGYEGARAYAREEAGRVVAMWDVYPRNFIKTESGLIVPIDVILTTHSVPHQP